MGTTHSSRYIRAPRSAVYRALLDPEVIVCWKVPDGMRAHVHAFDAREGGAFRVTLTYEAPTGRGKTDPHSDTYHGRFVRLVPDEQVVESVEFETADPTLRGEMTITWRLEDADGGTALHALHEGLPPGVAPADNELGHRQTLAKLAALVERAPSGQPIAVIDHTGIGVADVPRAAAFYDAALGALGLRRVIQLPERDGLDAVGYGLDYPVFWIDRFHPPAARQHTAFSAKTRAEVDAFHAAALDAGGTDNGPPGLRDPSRGYPRGYYAAFVRDPDGNNVEAVFRERVAPSAASLRGPSPEVNGVSRGAAVDETVTRGAAAKAAVSRGAAAT